MTFFRDLVKKALATGDLVVEFSPQSHPRYIPKSQSRRIDKKAIIQMPCSEYRMVEDGETDAKIDSMLSKVTLPDAMIIFSHELGHHFTSNPTYDDALSRCLKLPVAQRSLEDFFVVIKEETEAWVNGFDLLKTIGFEVPETAKTLAKESLLGYCEGALKEEPAEAAVAAKSNTP